MFFFRYFDDCNELEVMTLSEASSSNSSPKGLSVSLPNNLNPQIYHVQTLQTRVFKIRDVPLSLCLGTKNFTCLAVPLSRDKSCSKNPGTNFTVLGCPGTKPLSDWQKRCQKKSKIVKSKIVIFFSAVNCNICTLFSLLTRGCPRIIRPVQWQNIKMPSTLR